MRGRLLLAASDLCPAILTYKAPVHSPTFRSPPPTPDNTDEPTLSLKACVDKVMEWLRNSRTFDRAPTGRVPTLAEQMTERQKMEVELQNKLQVGWGYARVPREMCCTGLAAGVSGGDNASRLWVQNASFGVKRPSLSFYPSFEVSSPLPGI